MKQKLTALLALMLAVTCTACGSSETASAPEETKQTNAIVKPLDSTAETAVVPKPATDAPTAAPTDAPTDAPTEAQSEAADFSANTETRYVINHGASETIFAYPVFTDAQPDADRINKAIRTHLETMVLDYTMSGFSKDGNMEKTFDGEWDLTEKPDAGSGRTIVQGDYTVTRLDDEYICILFEGGAGGRSAVQTMKFAEGLILDGSTMERYTLGDLYTVDAGFTAVVEAALTAHGGESKLKGSDLQTSLEHSGTRAYGIGAYLRPEGLVIVLPGMSILEDWIELTLPYDDVAAYRK